MFDTSKADFVDYLLQSLSWFCLKRVYIVYIELLYTVHANTCMTLYNAVIRGNRTGT